MEVTADLLGKLGKMVLASAQIEMWDCAHVRALHV